MKRHLRMLPVVAALAVMIIVPDVFGQANRGDEDLGKFYDVPAMPAAKAWLEWLIGTILMFAVLAVAVLNPHRTHLD